MRSKSVMYHRSSAQDFTRQRNPRPTPHLILHCGIRSSVLSANLPSPPSLDDCGCDGWSGGHFRCRQTMAQRPHAPGGSGWLVLTLLAVLLSSALGERTYSQAVVEGLQGELQAQKVANDVIRLELESVYKVHAAVYLIYRALVRYRHWLFKSGHCR